MLVGFSRFPPRRNPKIVRAWQETGKSLDARRDCSCRFGSGRINAIRGRSLAHGSWYPSGGAHPREEAPLKPPTVAAGPPVRAVPWLAACPVGSGARLPPPRTGRRRAGSCRSRRVHPMFRDIKPRRSFPSNPPRLMARQHRSCERARWPRLQRESPPRPSVPRQHEWPPRHASSHPAGMHAGGRTGRLVGIGAPFDAQHLEVVSLI